MENHIGTDIGTMFELSVFKNRTPPDEVAFFVSKKRNLVDLILLNVPTASEGSIST